MSPCVSSFSNAAPVLVDEVGGLDRLPLDALWALDASGERGASEIRLKGGFTIIGVKAGLVFGIMRKSGRVWAT